MAKEIIDVVNENDEVIGQEDRDVVHQKGLLHRHVHVWLYNEKGQVIFQRRSKTTHSWPGRLDASTGGHLPAGMNYVEAALMELEEETGIKGSSEDLVFIRKFRNKSVESERNIINDTFNGEYAYKYNGEIQDLKSEEGFSFELRDLNNILNSDERTKEEFIPSIVKGPWTPVLEAIHELSQRKTKHE